MDDEKFRQELDELFLLFKKLLEREGSGEISGVNKFMFQQFQTFFSNYENMKGDIARQLQDQFGDSVKDMIHQLVLQLREAVGDEYIYQQEDTSVNIDIKPSPKKANAVETVEQIDELLKNPNLTEEEIDELLERRHKLTNY